MWAGVSSQSSVTLNNYVKVCSMSDPIQQLLENTKEVQQLLDLHEEKTGKKAGRRDGVEVLNKSAIVLLNACWEAFVEDCAKAAFEFMLKYTSDPKQLPKVVIKNVAVSLRASKNEIKVWDLAQDGWRDTLETYLLQMLHQHSTPNADNVDRLFDALLGAPAISDNWFWQKMSVAQAKKRLDEYIKLRGAIAHRVSASKSVQKKDVTAYLDFINRLARHTANAIREHVNMLTTKYPWDHY